MNHLSLFSGIGGLDLAAEMAGFKTVGQCEWADYPTKVLEKHWPDVPRWRDIRTLTGESFYDRTGLRTVDVVSGGFPCQPFSVAGKRRGKEDDRYLWPEMLRVIQELRPSWVVGENVAGIVNLALDQVLSDLENIGYAVQTLIIPACSVDAAHRRDRCAIVANDNKVRCGLRRFEGKGVYRDTPCDETDSGCKNVAYSTGQRRRETGRNISGQEERASCGCTVSDTEGVRQQGKWPCWKQVCGTRFQKEKFERDSDVFRSCERRPAKSGLGGVVDGVPAWMDRYWVEEPAIPRITTVKENRADRLKCLGNAVYWRQFYPIFQGIMEIMNYA